MATGDITPPNQDRDQSFTPGDAVGPPGHENVAASLPLDEIPIHVARVVERITDGFVMLDVDGRYSYVNGQAERILRKSRKEMLGKTPWQIFPDLVDTGFYRAVTDAQQSAEPSTLREFVPTAGVWLENNIFPTIEGTLCFFRDVTAEQQATERTSRLLALTTSLASAISIDEVARVIIAEALPALDAVAGHVFLLSNDQAFLTLLGAMGYDDSDTAGWRHFSVDTNVPLSEAVRRKELILVQTGGEIGGRYPAIAEVSARRGLGSLAAVPLVLSDRVIGAIGLRFPKDRLFSHEDRGYMLTLAGQCALALERARLYDSERRLRDEEHLLYLRSSRIENALLLSEERFRFAIEASDIGIWHRNFVTNEHVWSGRCRDICGLSRMVDVSYDLFVAILHPDDRERVDLAFRQAISSHETYEQEFRVVWPDGSVHWVYGKGRGYYDPTGEPVRYEGILLDIEERKRIEAALRDSELHLRLALTSGNLGAWSLDLVNERFTHVSDTYKAHFGRMADAAFEWGDLIAAIHPEDRTRVRAAIDHALRTRVDYDAEYRCVWPDGTTHWVHSHGRATFDRTGSPERMIGVSLDITERKRTDAELASLYAREHKIAATLQRSLVMPPVSGDFPLDVASLYEQASDEADVGGDFMDSFELPDGRVALVVCDVVGKGLKAASRTAEIKYTLRAFLHNNAPAESMSRLNRFLIHAHKADTSDNDMLAVLAVVIVDPKTGELAASVAGMEAPLIVRADGTHVELTARGLPLCVLEQAEFETARDVLNEGDLLVIVSDGITEARRSRQFLGYEGLIRLATAVDRTTNLTPMGLSILEGAKQFAGGTFNDDACLLLARRWPSTRPT